VFFTGSTGSRGVLVDEAGVFFFISADRCSSLEGKKPFFAIPYVITK
jgi:hypothetical protein